MDSSLQREGTNAQSVVKKPANLAWSHQATKRDLKQLRKDKKERKRKWLKSQSEVSPQAESEARKTSEVGQHDLDEFAREERMAKKVRRGRITQAAFDDEFQTLHGE